MTSRHIDTDRAIADWLASAHPNPSTAQRDWGVGGVALLPTGQAFDAVRISAAIVHAAAGGQDPDLVAAYLGDVVDGPVIHDAYDASVWYYALVPVDSCARHLAHDAMCLASATTWLGVPAVHRTARPGAYWISPPTRRGDLCTPEGVDEVVRLGRRQAG